MGLLELEYFALVFVAACGLLQAVFAFRKIEGLRFFGVSAASYGFAALTGIGSFFWFYSRADRNQLPVVEGVQQTALFMLGTLAAVVFTALLSSLIRRGAPRAAACAKPDLEAGAGLENLQRMTYFQFLSELRAKARRR